MTLEVVSSLEKRLTKLCATEPVDDKAITDILKRLSLQKVNYQILKSTKVGVTVKKIGKITKCDSNKLLVKNLVTKWKRQLPGMLVVVLMCC